MAVDLRAFSARRIAEGSSALQGLQQLRAPLEPRLGCARLSRPGRVFRGLLPRTSGVYLVPIEEVALRWQGALRIDETRNGQRRGIRYAADYEIAQVPWDRRRGTR